MIKKRKGSKLDKIEKLTENGISSQKFGKKAQIILSVTM
jgi:hypothetical protein